MFNEVIFVRAVPLSVFSEFNPQFQSTNGRLESARSDSLLGVATTEFNKLNKQLSDTSKDNSDKAASALRAHRTFFV